MYNNNVHKWFVEQNCNVRNFPIQFHKSFSQVTSTSVNSENFSSHFYWFHGRCGLHQRSDHFQFKPELKFLDHHNAVLGSHNEAFLASFGLFFVKFDSRVIRSSTVSIFTNQACSGQQRCIRSRMNGTRSKRSPELTLEVKSKFQNVGAYLLYISRRGAWLRRASNGDSMQDFCWWLIVN